MGMRRRRWLELAVLQAASGTLPGLAAEEIRFDTNPFQLGIASGQPSTRSVVLWTRLLAANPLRNPWGEQTVRVDWQMATDEQFAHIVQSGTTFAPPELSHSVHVEVEGLPPNQVFWYRFQSGGALSAVGRTRTLPLPDDTTTPLKIAFASCQRYHSGAFVAYDHMLADAPDLVVFLGDYIYEMGAAQNENRGTWMYPASKIADYRELYRLAKSDPSLQRMHANGPWLIIWDDHEVQNDYAGADVRLHGAGGNTARRMEMGYRTWYEHMPVSPRALTGGTPGLLANSHELRIYGTVRWGKTANLHLLDTRQYRSKQVSCGVAGMFKTDNCPDLNAPQRVMLGEAQSSWLTTQLHANGQHQAAATHWNLICQPSVFSPFVIPVAGGLLNHDNWDGYPAARERILADITTGNTTNPVLLGGDIHQNWVAHVHRDPNNPASPVVVPEFCVTSITTASIGKFTAQDMKALAPHCVYTDRHRRGYMLATLSDEKLVVDIRHVDIAANTATTSARFEVLTGSATVHQTA
jgi:alkaline phosphatase D